MNADNLHKLDYAKPSQSKFVCPTCNGKMVSSYQYRSSTPVVIIGYILLISSILGLIASAAIGISSRGEPQTVEQTRADEMQNMMDAGVPTTVIEQVAHSDPVLAAEQLALTPDQSRAVKHAQAAISSKKAGAGIYDAFASGYICYGVALFFPALLGWLLVRKKIVYQCKECSALATER